MYNDCVSIQGLLRSFVFLFCLNGIVLAQEPTLLLDINSQPAGINVSGAGTAGNNYFFVGVDRDHGRELWVSDGTEAGTRLVKDINPGTSYSNPDELTPGPGSLIFFEAFTADSGGELWISDGTEAGTHLVKDINPGTASSNPSDFVYVSAYDKLYFSAEDDANGIELWVSDGTEAGTQRISQINSTPTVAGDSDPMFLYYAPALNAVLFSADDSTNGRELWKVNPTTDVVSLVRNIAAGAAGSFPINFEANPSGSLVFFSATGANGTELYKTDGTLGGTVEVKNINAMLSGSSFPALITPLTGDFVVFTASDGSSGFELWRSDGLSANTLMIQDLNPGSDNTLMSTLSRVADARVVFVASTPATGQELFYTNGLGIALVSELEPGTDGGVDGLPFAQAGNYLFLRGHTEALGSELYVVDGTQSTPTLSLLADLATGTLDSSPANPRVTSSDDLLFTATTPSKQSLYKSSPPYTTVTEVSELSDSFTRDSLPIVLGTFNEQLVFIAGTFAEGREPYITDGSSAGTLLLGDLDPGSANSNGYSGLAKVNVNGTDRFIFSCSRPGTGIELCSSDGTAAGTNSLPELEPGALSGLQSGIVELNGKAYFTGFRSDVGIELFMHDGTNSAAQLVADINTGMANSDPSQMVVAAGKLFFLAKTVATGNELYVSDGTTNGTQLLKDFATGMNDLDIDWMTAGGSLLFFGGKNPAALDEQWIGRSDGTADGTFFFEKPDPQLSFSTTPGAFANGKLFFSAELPSTGFELWVSDGSLSGLTLLKDILSGTDSSSPVILTNAGDKLIFSAYGGSDLGFEPYVTDGTEAGTLLLKDINPGSSNSLTADFVTVSGFTIFTASDGEHGSELWLTDGTLAGTVLLKDIYPGPLNSFISELKAFNGKIFFRADDSVHGTEPFVVTIDECPADDSKLAAGSCGCGTAETDGNSNSVPDCMSVLDLQTQLVAIGELLKKLHTPKGKKDRKKVKNFAKQLKAAVKSAKEFGTAASASIPVQGKKTLEALLNILQRAINRAAKLGKNLKRHKKRARKAKKRLERAIA